MKQDLVGNNKVWMMCTLSPCFTTYEETLSNLILAEYVSKIKTFPQINSTVKENP